METQRLSPIRFPLLGASIATLLLAGWYGIVRLGWQITLPRPEMIATHGPLMISGFLGTLIIIERAAALRTRIAFAPALFSALGALALVIGLPPLVGRLLMVLGGLGLSVLFIMLFRQHPALHTGTMVAGAVAWLVGNALWAMGLPIFRVVFWWMGFLTLTIAGERLELSRVRRLSNVNYRLFLAVNAIFIAGAVLVIFLHDAGSRVAGAGLVALGLWLLRYDIASRTVRLTGLTRFIAVCLLIGYGWLIIAGTLLLFVGGQTSGLWYDAVLHVVFLGFVFALIFGHAPLVFPSVLGLNFAYHSRFYVHLILLQLSLILRLAGDITGWVPARLWGGLFNGIALILFLMSTLLALRRHSPTDAVAAAALAPEGD